MMADSDKKKPTKPSRMPFGISSIKDRAKEDTESPGELNENEDVPAPKKSHKKGEKTKEEKKKMGKLEGKTERVLTKPELWMGTENNKNKRAKGLRSELYTLWLRIEDFDPIPYEIDSSISFHEFKQRIHDDDQFELQFAKIHKMKCCTADGTGLDPRASIAEQLDDGQEIWVKLINGPVEKTEGLPRELGRPSSINGSSTPSTPNITHTRSAVDVDERAIKNSLVSLTKRLDDMDENLTKKNEAFDESVKQLSDLADRLKRMNGIPAVGNELRPALGGIPGLKSKDMTGHDGPVWTLSVGNENLFSGSSDTTVKVWDLNTLRVKHTLRGHTSIVHCVVAFNKDKTVVSGSDDKTIKIWDVENQTCKTTIRDDNIACVLRAHRGHLFSGSFKYVKVWNLSTQTLVGVLPGHNHWVRAITLANGYCFSGGHNVIKVWDMAKFNCVRTMTQPCGSIYSVLVNGNMLYAGTYENTVNIWDLRSYEFVRSLPGHTGAVYALALHGNKLFSGSYDNSIRVWDLATFQCVQRLTGHSSSVEALATSKDRLFSASTDQTIKSWRFPQEPIEPSQRNKDQ